MISSRGKVKATAKACKLAITPGDPAGVGFDTLIKAAQTQQQHELVGFCCREALLARAEMLKLPLKVVSCDAERPVRAHAAGMISVNDIPLSGELVPGRSDPQHTHYVLQCLRDAVLACSSGELHAMVTGPINKHSINQGLSPTDVNSAQSTAFSGHTEFLAELTSTTNVVMMLAVESTQLCAQALRVALVTTHLPLSQVIPAITAEKITRCVEIVDHDLRTKFGIETPRIAVCGLNPHAGEQGDLGSEEQAIINPCLHVLRQRGFNVTDALPADTVFTPHILADCDVVLAMYHDQGLAPLKSHGFGKAVNITLGLPIVRTSVDHGTAYDLAGSGLAKATSLQCAIDAAAAMASQVNVCG